MNKTPAKNRVERASAVRPAAHGTLFPKEGPGENRSSTTLSVIVPAYNEQYLIESSLHGLAVLDESPRSAENQGDRCKRLFDRRDC